MTIAMAGLGIVLTTGISVATRILLRIIGRRCMTVGPRTVCGPWPAIFAQPPILKLYRVPP